MGTSIQVPGGIFDSTSVVETVNGFPRGNKAVDAAFFAQILRCFYKNGVVRPSDGGFAVTPGGGLSVAVAPGCGWIDGHMAWLREEVRLPLAAGHSYAVVLRLDYEAEAFTLTVTEDGAPVRDETAWELWLAKVTVPAGVSAVTAAMLTDTRTDGAYCGAVTSAAEALNSTAYAENCGAIGGVSAAELVRRSGGEMTGLLRAAPETSGAPAVRNIRYGTSLPENAQDGEIFILLEPETQDETTA